MSFIHPLSEYLTSTRNRYKLLPDSEEMTEKLYASTLFPNIFLPLTLLALRFSTQSQCFSSTLLFGIQVPWKLKLLKESQG